MSLIAVLAVFFGACSGSESDGAAGGPAGGTVRMAAGEDPWPAEGSGPRSTTFLYPLNMGVYEPLIHLGSDYSLKPGLAERWELVDGEKTWRFHLRHGVKFHDGRPFTADDVLWTWTRQEEARKLTTVLETLGDGSIRKIDDFTVDFTPKAPNLRLPEQMLHPQGAILPQGNNFDSTPPVGTGPYKVAEYRQGESATFERFDGYWGTKAKVGRLEVKFMADPRSRVKTLQSGETDFVFDVPAADIAALGRDRRFRLVRSQPGRTHVIYVNKTGVAPYDLGADPSVRRAVSLAIDRKAYVDRVFAGNAEPGRWMAPRAVLGASADLVAPVGGDPAAARQELDGAGWVPGPDGVRAKGDRRLALTIVGWAEVPTAAYDLIKEQLAQVGIALTVNAAPDQATFRGFYRDTEFDLDLEVPSQNDANPAFLPVLRMYSRSDGANRFAPGGDFDVKAQSAAGAKTREEVQRTAAEMMRILVDDQHIVVPLAGVPRIYAMTNDVNLANPHPSQASQSWSGLSKS
ncbi:MAG: ABC transporter substrate-binding protein [Acidimicrobiales bacterium]